MLRVAPFVAATEVYAKRMGYYLFDNPPAVPQFYNPRRGKWTGGVLVHTAENIMDNVDMDTGAENIASFIRRRTDFGSYHILADSDSVIEMLPPTAVAYHCGAEGYNSTTVGVSYACRTVDLDPNSVWTKKATENICRVLVRWWQENGFDPLAAQFIPAPETKVRLGLSTHGEAQPADRSDAWTRSSNRPQLEALFLSTVKSLLVPTPPGVDPIMSKPVMMRRKTDGTISVFYQNTPFRVDLRPKDVDKFRFFGVEYKGDADPWFWEVTQAVKVG